MLTQEKDMNESLTQFSASFEEVKSLPYLETVCFGSTPGCSLGTHGFIPGKQ